MPTLFSYGSLQEEQVQLSTFGRRLAGDRDELPGFERVPLKLREPDVTVLNVVSNDATRTVGTVFEVSSRELELADIFEAPFGYKRISVRLASGRESWVYVHHA
jgi:gamma-glutamylcyclotransferase (GGCT)/AIG2-like uncharacterized protein YtfP